MPQDIGNLLNTDQGWTAEDTEQHGSRFWIMDTYDMEGDRPYGDDTVAIVDETQGGIILYTHRENGEAILLALRTASGNV